MDSASTLVTGPAALCEDILYHVFENFDRRDNGFRDWAAAALVCCSWTRPAQSAMYNTVAFYPSTIRNARWQAIIRSLERNPRLRTLLRHLTIWQANNPPNEQFEWMRLLPEHTLKTLHYSWRQHKPIIFIFDVPAVRTITHLSINGTMTPEVAKACFALPYLQTLHVTFYDCKSDDRDVEIRPPGSLKQLVVIVLSHNPFAYGLLAACAPQLSTLALRAPFKSMDGYGSILADTFVAHSGQLTRFTLFGWGEWEWSPARPFMDDLVRRNPTLERLHCLEGTYSEQLFRRLPDTLRVLELATGDAPYRYERALLEYIGRVGQEGLGLRRLCFRTSRKVLEPWTHVAEACDRSGVDFAVDQYREDMSRRAVARTTPQNRLGISSELVSCSGPE